MDLQSFQNELSKIPKTTPLHELPQRLKPILEKIVNSSNAEIEVCLGMIKKHFGLNANYIIGYRKDIEALKKKQKPHVAYTASFDGLVDIVDLGGQPAFLVKLGHRLKVLRTLKIRGEIYLPPPKHQLPYLVPRAQKVISSYRNDDDARLFDDLLRYHKGISVLPSEAHYDLLTAWDFHTYLLEKVQYSAIIWFYSVPERGKTRTGKGMIYVTYRGIYTDTPREASLIRYADYLKATLFIDVLNLSKNAARLNIEDILQQRYERGLKVPRVLHYDRGPFQDMVYYDVFGATVVATNEPVNPVYETRAIQINMPHSDSKFDDIKPEMALKLKERLTAFRARHMNEELLNIPKAFIGRLGDLIHPLHQIIKMVRPERENSFLSLIQDIQESRKVDSAESLEAAIIATLIKLKGSVSGGLLSVKTIADHMPKGGHYVAPQVLVSANPKLLGRRLKELGFKKRRRADGSYIEYDDNLVHLLAKKYGVVV